MSLVTRTWEHGASPIEVEGDHNRSDWLADEAASAVANFGIATFFIQRIQRIFNKAFLDPDTFSGHTVQPSMKH
jgi:hypothetical protein